VHLASIDIENFRLFKKLHVDLRNGLNVLVGRNNIGKSNLLEAIRHALGPSALRGDTIWLEEDDFHRDMTKPERESSLTVSLTFSNLSESQRSQFFEILDFDLMQIANSKAIITFKAQWRRGDKHPTIRRVGGPLRYDAPEVSSRQLQALPVTFLPALRDAEDALAPGMRSRLAKLLHDISRGQPSKRSEIVDIFTQANAGLLANDLITKTTESLQTRMKAIAGTDYTQSRINAADSDFDKILRTLQVQMVDSPLGALSANGLGINNLLYMAVVLEHLKRDTVDEFPLLLVEEPEAHLHPQLVTLLAEYLSSSTPGSSTPQTLVTTHSQTLTASVPPDRIHVLFPDLETKSVICNSLEKAGMNNLEQLELQRMMDITRATMYFAKGVILVEGICESLLIPALASRIGVDLSKLHISVIPICGVAFSTFAKLLQKSALGIPVAIVSDADPTVIRGKSWEEDMPEAKDGYFSQCDRIALLRSTFESHPSVKVFSSKVTLEFDLAEAGDNNAIVMAEVWESLFVGKPKTFNRELVSGPEETLRTKALTTWRGICRASHSGSKAELAHRLSAKIRSPLKPGEAEVAFLVPHYICEAIAYVKANV